MGDILCDFAVCPKSADTLGQQAASLQVNGPITGADAAAAGGFAERSEVAAGHPHTGLSNVQREYVAERERLAKRAYDAMMDALDAQSVVGDWNSKPRDCHVEEVREEYDETMCEEHLFGVDGTTVLFWDPEPLQKRARRADTARDAVGQTCCSVIKPGPGPLHVERPERQDFRTRGEYECGGVKCSFDGVFRKPTAASQKQKASSHVEWYCPLCRVILSAPNDQGVSVHPAVVLAAAGVPVAGDFRDLAPVAPTMPAVVSPTPAPLAAAPVKNPPTVAAMPPEKPEKEEKKAKEITTLLDGRRLSDEEAEDFAASLGCGARVRLETLKVKYDGEKRLVTHRNVQETKQGFVIQRVHCACLTVGWWNLLYLALIPAVYFGLPVGVALGVLLSLGKTFFSVSKLGSLELTLALKCTAWLVGLPSGISEGMLAAGLLAGCFPRWFGIFYVADRRTIVFCPHMVSCAMTEYENGACAETVRANTRQKLQRLATLPVPDSMSVALMAGSEQVVYYLAARESFFEEGATYDASPL